MSRTDHHNPYWVRAMHTHHEGGRTRISHGPHCEDYRGFRYGGGGFATGPEPTRITSVPLAAAEASGWHIYPAWTHDRHGVPYVRAAVPVEAHPCDPDRHDSGCRRIIADDRNGRHRWYGELGPSREDLHEHYYGPERRAVRDSLRNATKIHRSAADLDDLDDIDPPTRQARRSTWAGGWWD